MNTKQLIDTWFTHWEKGAFQDLPISENFTHTSPFGTIEGKKNYLDLVAANADKFLGYRFQIHDCLLDGPRACVRYTAIQGDFRLEVSEWYFINNNQIKAIIAYYHMGEIREDRKLKMKS